MNAYAHVAACYGNIAIAEAKHLVGATVIPKVVKDVTTSLNRAKKAYKVDMKREYNIIKSGGKPRTKVQKAKSFVQRNARKFGRMLGFG